MTDQPTNQPTVEQTGGPKASYTYKDIESRGIVPQKPNLSSVSLLAGQSPGHQNHHRTTPGKTATGHDRPDRWPNFCISKPEGCEELEHINPYRHTFLHQISLSLSSAEVAYFQIKNCVE